MAIAKPRRGLRKKHVRVRYGWEATFTVDRNVENGNLPQPDTWMGRSPIWWESSLDAHDAKRKTRKAVRS
jgi:hypothetical protein